MPEVLVQLLARFWRFIPGLTGLGMAGSYSQWAGQQSSQGTPGGIIDTIFHSILNAPAAILKAFGANISQAHKATRSAISHWALAADTETARWFDHLNLLARETYAAQLSNVKVAADAIRRLQIRERTDTHYANGVHVKTRANTALKTASTAITRGAALSSAFTRTRRAQVKVNERLTRATTVTIPGELGRIRAKDKTQDGAIAGLRDAVRGLEDGAIDTFKWLSTHRTTAAMGVFAGAVAWALERLGWGVLRCRSWQNLGRSLKCSDANVLRDLLTAATLIVGAMSLVELAREEQKVIGSAATIVRDLWEI